VINGKLALGQKIRMMGTNNIFQVTDLGKFTPRPTKVPGFGAGEVALSWPTSRQFRM